MADKLDRPLDEIISEENKSRPRRGRGGARGGRGRGSRQQGDGGNRRHNPLSREDDGQGDYAPMRQPRGARAAPYGRGPRPAPLSADSDWQHDMFGGGTQAQSRVITRGSSKVLISNLDSEVTVSDLQEIFQECGPISDTKIDVDPSTHKHLGTATITFRSQQAAEKAVREFDGAAVDNRPMYLKIVPPPGTSRIHVVPAQQPAPIYQERYEQVDSYQNGGGRGGHGRAFQRGRGRGGDNSGRRGGSGAGGGRGRGGRGGRGRGGREKRAEVSAESLDADMDAYKQQAPSKEAAASE